MPFGQIAIEGGQTGQQLIQVGQPATLQNIGPSTVYLSDRWISNPGDLNSQTPLDVNAVVTYDGTSPVWGACIVGDSAVINRHPGAASFFKPSRAVASAVIATVAPSNPQTGDLWFDSSAGNELYQWDGSAWVAYQYGTDAIAAGSVTAALIAAGTVVAGIVDSTTITAATLILNGTAGQLLIYSGAPAFGNLIASISGYQTTDSYGNTVYAGMYINKGAINGAVLNAGSVPSSAVGFTAQDIGGISTYVAATAPSSANTGDLWYDSSNDYKLNRYSGTAWTAYQFGTNAISAGSITAALIAANTITTSQLAAGIVYAGIVDGTTITGATFVADGTSGEILAYSGSPASGNLILSVSPAAGTDGYSNAYKAGVVYYGASGSYVQLYTDSSGSPALVMLAGGATQIVWVTAATIDGVNGIEIGAIAGLSNILSRMGLQGGAGGLLVVENGAVPADPTAGYSTAEGWHPGTYATGWTGNLYYRLLLNGDVELAGTANGSAPNTDTTIANLPPGYRAASTTCYASVYQSSGGYSNPGVSLNTSGALVFQKTAGSGSNVLRLDGVILAISRP